MQYEDFDPSVRCGILKIGEHCHNMIVEDQWVTCNGENILWLPLEHRPASVAVYGSKIALGYGTGSVSFFEFDFRFLEGIEHS